MPKSKRQKTPSRLKYVEEAIAQELASDKQLAEDSSLPISTYNYSAIRDRLTKLEISVSLSTIINRAKDSECYQHRRRKKTHDREVMTTAIGVLVQHDASHHRWSPYAKINGYSSLPWTISATKPRRQLRYAFNLPCATEGLSGNPRQRLSPPTSPLGRLTQAQ